MRLFTEFTNQDQYGWKWISHRQTCVEPARVVFGSVHLSEDLLTCRGCPLPASPSLCLRNEFLTSSSTDFWYEMLKQQKKSLPSVPVQSNVQPDVHVRTVVRKELQHIFYVTSAILLSNHRSEFFMCSWCHWFTVWLRRWSGSWSAIFLLLRSGGEFLEQRWVS